MKKLLILLLLLNGCTTLNHIPPKNIFYGFDFRKYAEKNFLITPEMYQGEYMTMGIVNCEIYPEAFYISTSVTKTPDGEYSLSGYKWIMKQIDPESAIDSMYFRCINMGADALVNFRIESVEEEYSNIKNPITINGIKVSGYAINRLD